jgi:hypothetical protein
MGSRRPNTSRKRGGWGILVTLAGTIVALGALAGWVLQRPRSARAPGETAEVPASAPSRTDFPALAEVPSLPNAASPRSPSPAPSEHVNEVAEVVRSWRNAILQRDPEAVTRLDLTFREAPDRYTPALVQNATSDPEDRVRAFSTRVLGKLHHPALAEVFQKLLRDRSPHVRQNAAWALAELSPDRLR